MRQKIIECREELAKEKGPNWRVRLTSVSTASLMIAYTSSCESFVLSCLYSRHAKSQCMPVLDHREVWVEAHSEVRWFEQVRESQKRSHIVSGTAGFVIDSPSSREMSSLEKVSPGMRPRFFSQNTAQKDPEKKIPSTTANATRRSGKDANSALHHLSAHCAFFFTQGIVSMALNRLSFSFLSLMYVSIRRE